MHVVVFGSGQTANMVVSILEAQDHEIVGMVDDSAPAGTEVQGNQILGNREWLREGRGFDAVCVGIGTISARKAVCGWLDEFDIPTISAIHPSAVVDSGAQLGRNLIVGASSTLYVNPIIGDGTYVGPGAIVCHDTTIGSHCLLSMSSSIGARCDIGNEVLIGSGATVMIPQFGVDARLTVGDGAVAGIGAAVIRDVPPGQTVVGVPAKPIALR